MTDEEKRFDRREEARLDDMYDAQCERCGEVNPAEIHTCTPNYIDRRQWKYDPMTGEPLVEGWALYCVGCAKQFNVTEQWSHGYKAGYAQAQETDLAMPRKKWVGLTDEEMEAAISDSFSFGLADGNVPNKMVVQYARSIEARLKEKNT